MVGGDRDARESLGWLAQSSVQPKKRRLIEGVSGGTVVDLQAQLYRAQEQARLHKEGNLESRDKYVRRKAGVDVHELLGKRNAGVSERDAKDRLSLKSTTGDRALECYEALSRKAELYERLARGEMHDDDEGYEVDFMRKGPEAPHTDTLPAREAEHTSEDAPAGVSGFVSHGWLSDEEENLESLEEQKRQAHKEAILELTRQTHEQRSKALEIKQQKDDILRAKRERLKAQFLKQKLAAAGGAKSE